MADPKVLVTERGSLDRDVTATTPSGMTDVRVVVQAAWQRVLVRVARTYLQSFLGILTALLVGVDLGMGLAPVPAWEKISAAALWSLFPTFFALAQNALELLARLDATNPEVRG